MLNRAEYCEFHESKADLLRSLDDDYQHRCEITEARDSISGSLEEAVDSIRNLINNYPRLERLLEGYALKLEGLSDDVIGEINEFLDVSK